MDTWKESIVSLFPLTEAHRGTYRCEANNGIGGVLSKTITVSVRGEMTSLADTTEWLQQTSDCILLPSSHSTLPNLKRKLGQSWDAKKGPPFIRSRTDIHHAAL